MVVPVPIFVPTPRIEALCTVAHASSPGRRKSLITGNNAQQLVATMPSAKSMKERWSVATNQKVGRSSRSGRTTNKELSRH
jgi:hypothetical protein